MSVTAIDRAADGPAFVTLMRYVNVMPGETDVSTTTFVAERSALADRRVGGTGGVVLLAGTGSGVGLATVAGCQVAAVAGIVRIELRDEHERHRLAGVERRDRRTGHVLAAAVQPSAEDTNVTPAGSVSVTTTSVATDGPWFETSRCT